MTVDNIVVDENAVKNLSEDHPYARDSSKEPEVDAYTDAIDLNMGKDYFTDSQSISCKEETVDNEVDEENTSELDAHCSSMLYM